MKRSLQIGWLSIGLLVTLQTQAQEWTFGPKVNFGLNSNRTQSEQVQIGSVQVATTDYGDAVGASVGAFARYDRARWYAAADVTRGRYSLASVTVSGESGSSALYQRARRTNVQLTAGYKPLPWLRISAGLIGARSNWQTYDYFADIQNAERQLEQSPTDRKRFAAQIEQYRVIDALQNSYERTSLEGLVGIGADIGGLMVDLTYAKGLSPVLQAVSYQGQSYPLRQQYGYWSLSLAYRLFPLKDYALAPRKNKAYERIKKDIPFYRNEFHLAGGLVGEDIGSRFIYENRYTRYLKRRLGLSIGLNFTQEFAGNGDTYGAVRSSNAIRILAGVRFLPLYSRRHTIGLTTGPLLAYQDDFYAMGGGQTINGQYVRYLDLRADATDRGLKTGWHSSIDYQLSLTDRLIAGPWLRVLGQSFIIPDYATFGVQAGYRF
ncbi:hypothetical protein [Spirosoma pomorum]